MTGQKALRFHQKDLHLCSEDEQKSYGFGTTCGYCRSILEIKTKACTCLTLLCYATKSFIKGREVETIMLKGHATKHYLKIIHFKLKIFPKYLFENLRCPSILQNYRRLLFVDYIDCALVEPWL